MTFDQAIRIGFQKYATFSGRARRAEYWWFILFIMIGDLTAGILDSVLFGATMENVGILGMVFSLVALLPSLAVAARRLHDIDRTALWLFIAIVPLIGWIVLLVFFITPGTSGTNRFGPDPLSVQPDENPTTGFVSSSIPRSGRD